MIILPRFQCICCIWSLALGCEHREVVMGTSSFSNKAKEFTCFYCCTYSDSQNCSNVSNFWKKSLITPSGKSVNIWKYLGGQANISATTLPCHVRNDFHFWQFYHMIYHIVSFKQFCC